MADETPQPKFTTPELVTIAMCLTALKSSMEKDGSLLTGYMEKLFDRLNKEIQKRPDKFDAMKFICSMDPALTPIIGSLTVIQNEIDKLKNFYKNDDDSKN